MKRNRIYLGVSIIVGLALGVATKNIALWLSIGVAIGISLSGIPKKN